MLNERKKGVILSYIQVAVSIVVKLIYVPVLIRYLGQGEYGLYQLVGSLFSYITVFESCMSTAVLRNYCNALGRKDAEEANAVLYTARRVYQFLSAVLMAAGIVLVFGFKRFYSGSLTSFELKEGSAILLILVVNMLATLLGSVYTTMVIGHERFLFYKGSTIVTQILQPFLVIALVREFPYAFMVSIGFTAVNILNTELRRRYSKKYISVIRKCGTIDKKIMHAILSLSLTVLFASIADQIFWKADQIILGKLYNTAVIAVYSVGSQIYMIYMQLGTQIASVFYPRLSTLYAEESGLEKVSNLFIRVGRLTFYVILLILSGFILFGKEFLMLWVGNGYVEAYYVAVIVMIPFSVDLAQNLGLPILQITGQYGFRAKMYFLCAVLNIFTTVLLAVKFGIVGAAISTGLSMTLTSGIIMNYYYQHRTGLNIHQYWRQTAPILGTAFLLTALALFTKKLLGLTVSNVVSFLGAAVIYAVIYVLVMYLCTMNEEERSLIHSLLH